MRPLFLMLALTFGPTPSFAADGIGFEQCAVDKPCLDKTSPIKDGTEKCRAIDNKDIVLRQSEWRDGKLNGSLICRSFTGQIVMEAQYKNGKLDGIARDYSDHRSFGDVKEGWHVRHFNDGVQTGVEFFADQKDKVLHIIPNCWVRDGSGSMYWDECKAINFGVYNSQIQAFIGAENKKRLAQANGPVLHKYENGQTRFSATLKDGRYEGPAVRYWKNGKIAERSLYKAGEILSRESFFESGSPEGIVKFEKGQETLATLFWENGKKRQVTETKYAGPSSRTEHVTEYYDNGQMLSDVIETYAGPSSWGERTGKATSYQRDGTLILEELYDKGRLQGVRKIWNPERNRYWEETYDKGKLTEVRTFDAKTKRLLEKAEYFGDGSIKSEQKFD